MSELTHKTIIDDAERRHEENGTGNNGRRRKEFYKRPLWITLMAVLGLLALFYEALQGINVALVQPVSAAVDKRIKTITATEIEKRLLPLKKGLQRDHIGQLKINANLRATMTEEQKNIGAVFFKTDSAIDANANNTSELPTD
jgi:hypothetical protein